MTALPAGPWTWRARGRFGHVVESDADDLDVAEVDPERRLSPERAEAVARLLAAAPDLASALSFAVELFGQGASTDAETLGGAWYRSARAALGRVQGGGS